MADRSFTRTAVAHPPKDAKIEWLDHQGRIVAGAWCGGAVWFPEGSSMYVYYVPEFWRLAQ